MRPKRPWKVHFHHDGTRQFSDDENLPGSYVVDTSRPIDGTSAHADEASAEVAARRVSRSGGSARIVVRDDATGVEREIRSYAPYEVALESSTGGMAREVGERLGEVGCALSSGSVGSLSIAPAATSDAANTPTTKHASRPQSGLGNAVAHVVRRRPPAPRRRRHPVPGHRDGRRLVPGRTRIAVYGTVLWSWWVISAPPQGGRIPTTSVVGLDVARTTQQPPGRAGGRACDQRRGERLPRSGASS